MFSWLTGGGAAFRDPGGVRISVNDADIAELYPLLTEVSVDASRQGAVAALTFAGVADETGAWLVQDGDAIRVRDAVLIEAAFGDQTEEVFRGFVVSVQPSYPRDQGRAQVLVDCRDETLSLDRTHRTYPWGADASTSDREIAMRIADAHGLTLTAGSGEGQTGITVDQSGSDIAFLRERARVNGYEFYVRAGELHFGPMQTELEPQPTLMVYAGRRTNCLSLDIRDDAHRADAVRFETAPAEGDAAVSEAACSDLPPMGTEAARDRTSAAGSSEWRMQRAGGAPEEEVRATARGIANEEAMRISAQGEADGALYGHVLLTGAPVGVSGIGARYSGRWYVENVSHRFSAEGYTQGFRLIRNAYGDDLADAGGVLANVL